jgi:hypothetical protein
VSRHRRVGRGGFAAADVVLTLAVLSVAAALYAPFARQRAFETRLELAIADVEELRARARSYRAEHGSWPTAAELQLDATAGESADGGELGWVRWQTVRPTTATPPGATSPSPSGAGAPGPRPPEIVQLGSVTLRTGDSRLLAALLHRFGEGLSFVRDSTWTLLLAPAPAAPAAASSASP